MVTVEVEVEAGPRVNQKQKRDQLAWYYRDGTGGGGDGEDVGEDEDMLRADKRNAPGPVVVGLV